MFRAVRVTYRLLFLTFGFQVCRVFVVNFFYFLLLLTTIMVDVKVTDQVKLMIESLKMFYGKSFIDLIQIFVGRKYEIRLAGETAR